MARDEIISIPGWELDRLANTLDDANWSLRTRVNAARKAIDYWTEKYGSQHNPDRCACPPEGEREGRQWVCVPCGVDQARCKCIHMVGDTHKCPVHGHMNPIVAAISEANGKKARYCRSCDSWWPVVSEDDEEHECGRFCEAEKAVAL